MEHNKKKELLKPLKQPPGMQCALIPVVPLVPLGMQCALIPLVPRVLLGMGGGGGGGGGVHEASTTNKVTC